jgi:hypothetical protein
MDRVGWADEEVQAIIAQEFVPVRVDTDRRPDINQRYNLGGWPTTAILTPTGEVLTGGTYIPPDELKQILKDVVRIYHSRKAEIYAEILKGRSKREKHLPTGGELNEETAEKATAEIEKAIMRSFDPVYGGFGVAPKFPAFDPLESCLNRATTTGDQRFKNIVMQTLNAIATGGLWDAVEGGFFRYATQEDWSSPHYEKMLEDNARFVEILARAGEVLAQDLFKERARQTLAYLKKTLKDPRTGFYWGSQDADEEYYALDTAEERAKVRAPAIDHTVYVGWNALMAGALIRAGLFLNDPELRQEGVALTEALARKMWDGGHRLVHCWNGEMVTLDYLNDYVLMAEVLFEAFEETGDPKYVTFLEELLARAKEALWDENVGAYRDTSVRQDAVGQEEEPRYPLGDNSRMALLLARWSALSGSQEAEADGLRILGAFQHLIAPYGIFAAPYAEAVRVYLRGPAHIVVTGGNDGATEARLILVARKWGAPGKVVIHGSAVPHFAGAEVSGISGPAALVCLRKSCLPPIRDAEALKQLLAAHVP